MNITFADLLTPQGVVIAAGLTTTLIAFLRYTFTVLDERVSGAYLAFAITAVLYVLAAIATGTATLDAGLLVFMAWLSCATSAVGVHSTIQHARESAE